jgi:hypothetical protein
VHQIPRRYDGIGKSLPRGLSQNRSEGLKCIRLQ